LQLGRAFSSLLDLTRSISSADRPALRGACGMIADAILDGARDRGTGTHVRSAIDQQRRTAPLTRLRSSRPGRTPQALAARHGDKVAA
jgi:hypothetical protein